MSFNSVQLKIDDTDPTLLYSGAWFTAGNASSEFNGTTHGTNTAGSTMTYRFTGTS
ncbi:hypothetical protein OE88DRAFT_1663252 [Heliocybe sulcata]|uniref:Uncharacterized protein n=1 Tax=Heliocybe sulcata TaxID=5364 RepID=A0A5C3MXQ8_9AGAM|nr:hypothetical protein OE88DRAFT_1663252 [Heliocybe sulcata]